MLSKIKPGYIMVFTFKTNTFKLTDGNGITISFGSDDAILFPENIDGRSLAFSIADLISRLHDLGVQQLRLTDTLVSYRFYRKTP